MLPRTGVRGQAPDRTGVWTRRDPGV